MAISKLRQYVVVVLVLLAISACSGGSATAPAPTPKTPVIEPAPGTVVHNLPTSAGTLTLTFDMLNPSVGSTISKGQQVTYRYYLSGGNVGQLYWVSVIALNGNQVVGNNQDQHDPCNRGNGGEWLKGSSGPITALPTVTSTVTRLYGRVWVKSPDGTYPACAAATFYQDVSWVCQNCD